MCDYTTPKVPWFTIKYADYSDSNHRGNHKKTNKYTSLVELCIFLIIEE